jgi:hypothetical protein
MAALVETAALSHHKSTGRLSDAVLADDLSWVLTV